MDASLHARLTPQGLLEFAKHEADGIVQKECIGPFEDVVRKEVPHVTVSGELPSYSYLSLPVE